MLSPRVPLCYRFSTVFQSFFYSVFTVLAPFFYRFITVSDISIGKCDLSSGSTEPMYGAKAQIGTVF